MQTTPFDGTTLPTAAAYPTTKLPNYTFMDATQNHYVTFDYVSPVVFLGRQRYTEDTQLFPLISQLAAGREYADYLYLPDEPADVVTFIDRHPPLHVTK
jgi:hypothetical protein